MGDTGAVPPGSPPSALTTAAGALAPAPARDAAGPVPRPARRDALRRRGLLAADVVAALAAGAAGGLAAGGSHPGGLALAFAFILLAAGFATGLHGPHGRSPWATGTEDLPRLALAGLLASWPALGVAALAGAPNPVRGALAAGAVAPLAGAVARAAVRLPLQRAAPGRRRALIVGSGPMVADVVARLAAQPQHGLDPVGHLDDAPAGAGPGRLPWLGGLERLGPLLTSGSIDHVLVAFSPAGDRRLTTCVRQCREAGVAVDVVPRLFEHIEGARVVTVAGLPLLSLAPAALPATARAVKRALDVVGSIAGLVLLAPALAVLAAAIKLDSRGPVLFVQPRTGRHGRVFRLYKLRSMHVGARETLRGDGSLAKAPGDGRTTRVGRLLRRLSLDEAPQLVNVLRGEMSLVGPRPLVLTEADTLDQAWQERRTDLRPGLTGPWQVSGRSRLPFAEMIRLDFDYVTGWSLARDLQILLATVPAVLSGRGAC